MFIKIKKVVNLTLPLIREGLRYGIDLSGLTEDGAELKVKELKHG